jgi:hypothetical protein
MMAFRRDIARVFLGWAKAAHRQARAQTSPRQENTLLRNGPELRETDDCQIDQFPGSAGCSWPALIGGLWHFWVLGSAAPCGTPRIGTVADQLASPNRVAPRVDRDGMAKCLAPLPVRPCLNAALMFSLTSC